MKWHDCKTDKPKKSDFYLTAFVKKGRVTYMSNIDYDIENDGWNIDFYNNPPTREYEMFPDYWTKMPTLDELERSDEQWA